MEIGPDKLIFERNCYAFLSHQSKQVFGVLIRTISLRLLNSVHWVQFNNNKKYCCQNR